MRRNRLFPSSLFLAFLAGTFLSAPASAEVTKILDEPFTEFDASSSTPVRPTQMKKNGANNDWWRIRAAVAVHQEDPSGSGNLSAKFNTAAGVRYICTSPLSGMFGTLSFDVCIVGNNLENGSAPVFTLALAPSSQTDFRTWPAAGVEVLDPISFDMSKTNQWVTYTYTFNREISTSEPKRLLFARMDTTDVDYQLLVDNIVLKEAVATLAVEDDLYVTANSVVADPAAATTAVVAGGTVAPHVSFTTYLQPADVAVTLHYRTVPGGTWQTRAFATATTNEAGVITYALSGDTLNVGDQSGAQLEMYATATYTNDEGAGQSVLFACTEANPLRVDVLPRSPHLPATHTNLVVSGALEAPMDASTNGVWVGVYERSGGVGAGGTYCFDFGEGASATSRTYGDDVSTIPFKNAAVANDKAFPAPSSLDRDVVFRYVERGIATREGTVLLSEVQTFEDWAATQANGWSLGNVSGTAAVVTDAALAMHGSSALYLAAGDSLVLDKGSFPGVKEIGFWMRRAGDAAASATLARHRAGQSANDTLKTFTALPTDRYVFCSFSLESTQNPMGTDGVTITAVAPVYFDGVFATDCSTATLDSLALDPEPPLRQREGATVTATFTLAGGARFRDGEDAVLVKWGQGNSAAVATNTAYATTADNGATWTATIPALESGDTDLYYYLSADAFDFGGDTIGTLVSETNCVSVLPYSGLESLDIARIVGGAEDTTAMRLAAEEFWKGAIAAPAAAQSNVAYQFVDDFAKRYGGAAGATVPAAGELIDDGSVTAESVDSAIAFEFDEAAWTYNVRQAKYAPLDGALPSGWTTTGTVAHSPTGATFAANAAIVSAGNTGVGQVWFWAKRAGSANVSYTVEYSVSDTGTWSRAGISGATGTIASETVRFYAATVGNNDAKRIRITFTGGEAFVQDVVATASGSYVSITNPKISTTEDVADAVASSTASGPTVAYGEKPMVWVDVAPANGAHAIHVNVEAVSVDDDGNPLEGAETALIPMTGNADEGGTFSVLMPALPAGRLGYRFVATYEGVDATQTTDPATGYYVYETDANLEAIRTPDFSTVNHTYSATNSLTVQGNWRALDMYVDRFLPNSIAFVPEAGISTLTSARAFNGIGRIYFKAHKQIQEERSWVQHFVDVQISDDGRTWETINTVEIPFGFTEADDTQFCIEVNTYDAKRIRFVRDTSDDDPTCFLFIRDVVVTPPSANVDLFMPSIVHPGYPSQYDDITFRVDVESHYADYPAVAFRPVLKWRKYTGATAGAWNGTDMAAAGGSTYECTLPAMAPGRVEYYVETHFSGAAYDYTTSDKYDASMPLQFYFAYDDTMLDTDPKNGKEGSSPSYLFAKDASPEEFSHEVQQRALFAPGTVDGDSATPYLWFKVRTFLSHHRELQFVYTDALEPVEDGAEAVVHTNALRLVGPETWLTTIPVTNTVSWSGKIYGVDPYEGATSSEYGLDPTVWGDPEQATVNPPLASVAAADTDTPIVADHGMKTDDPPTRLMVRLDTTTGAYQIRQAAYQDFNDWSADPTYYEDSTGLYDTLTYEEAFDNSAYFPETTMGKLTLDFFADRDSSAPAMTEDNELGSYYPGGGGWRLRNGWVLRERIPVTAGTNNEEPNYAIGIEPHAGYLENDSGASVNADGLDYVSFRYRSSFGGNGHLPYYKGGFDWKDYTVFMNNVRISQMSPAEPYIQVIAGYADEDNYFAMRLTQMRNLNNTSVRNWIKQELIRVQNGVETVLSCRTAKNYAAPTGNVLSNRFDNLELTGSSSGNGWWLSLSVTNNCLDGRAFPTWDRSKGTNCLFVANALANTDSAQGGTISFDAYDAIVSFGGVNVRSSGATTNSNTFAEKWNLGGVQKGGSSTRWTADASGVSNKMPPLPFTVEVSKAGTSESLPSGDTPETVYSGNAGSLAYATLNQSVHYWGNAYVRIVPQTSDARLVIDDLEVKSWRGKSLPESDPSNHSHWQAREAVVVTRGGSRQLELSPSRANPANNQMVSTPEMLEGVGTISFNYEAVGGNVTFVIEENLTSGSYADDSTFVQIEDDPVVTALAGERGEVYRAVRKDKRGKIRVRILPAQSDAAASLYIDNLYAKGYPPDDGRSWTAYNTLIVAPTRNATVDPLQFEDDVSTQTAFLNNGVDSAHGTRPNVTMTEHQPYVQSPVINTGIGEIGFWYRVYDASRTTPGVLTLWVAKASSAEEREWRQITVDDLAKPELPKPAAPQSEWDSYNEKLAAWEIQKEQFDNLSCITNSTYQYFTAEICNDTNYVLRICADTNGAQRVAIDNVIVTEPVRASIDVLSVGMYPNDIPLGNEKVGFEVRLGNPRMNPTDIHVFAEYFIGTNVWGVANWASNPDGAIELVQDKDDKFLYRSSTSDMVPGLPVDSVVQYRVRVTYTGTFASPVVDSSFENPPWYEPIDLNKIYGTAPGSTNIVNPSPYYWVFSCPTGCVRINEFYPAPPESSDFWNQEYVEIIGPANASLKGWTLDVVDGGEASEREDSVLWTYQYPDDAAFIAPEGSTHGWGFYVAGDSGEVVADKVNAVWTTGTTGDGQSAAIDPADANLPYPGAFRLRRSMGAYVDLVSYGTDAAQNTMPDRGYTWTDTRYTRLNASNRRRSYALATVDTEDSLEFKWRVEEPDVRTLGDMNTGLAAELWGDCPYEIAGEFADATAEALSEYFDKYNSEDFLILLTLNDAKEFTSITVDGTALALGTDYTTEDGEASGTLRVALKASTLLELDLSTNETHTVVFTMDEGLAPEVVFEVIDSTPEAGDRSTRIVPSITAFRVEDGKAIFTLVFTNEGEAGSTAEGWKWAIRSSADVGFTEPETGEWTPLTDADLDTEIEAEVDVDGNAQFYKAVTSDEP